MLIYFCETKVLLQNILNQINSHPYKFLLNNQRAHKTQKHTTYSPEHNENPCTIKSLEAHDFTMQQNEKVNFQLFHCIFCKYESHCSKIQI